MIFQEEEEKALKEEQERKELEEYLKLKETFSVEEEGFDQEDPGEEVVNVYFLFYKIILIVMLALNYISVS